MTRSLLALLCLAPAVAAQDNPPSLVEIMDRAILERVKPEVTSRLRSEIPATIAWGAYLAGRYGVKDAVPRLRELLQGQREAKVEPRRFLCMALLDALVKLGAEVESADIAPFSQDYTLPQVVILACRAPEKHEQLLLDLFEQVEDEDRARIAAGNALAELKAEDFARICLESLELRLTVTVRNPGQNPGGLFGMGRGGALGGKIPIPKAYPPIFEYRLATWARGGEVVINRGPDATTFYTAVECTDRALPLRTPYQRDLNEQRIGWTRQAQHGRGRVPELKPRYYLEVEYRDAAAYVEAVRTKRAEIEAAHAALVAFLLEADDLTDVQARKMSPKIVLRVSDERDPKGDPLPDVN